MEALVIVILLLSSFCVFRCIWTRDKYIFHPFNKENTLPLRGILALAIVLHHLALNANFSFSAFGKKFSIIEIFITLGPPIVAVFFFISGYGLCKSLIGNGKEYLAEFFPKRMSKVLPEFIFLTICSFIILFFVLHEPFSIILYKFKQASPPLPNSWFIYVLILTYVVFYFSAKIAKGNAWLTLIPLSIFLLLICLCLIRYGYSGIWYRTTPSIIIGYSFGLIEPYIDKIFISKIKTPLLIILCFIMLAFSYYSLIVATFWFVVMVYFFSRLYLPPKWSALILLGDLSFYIYLTHGIFIGCFVHYLNPYLLLIVVFAFSLLSAIAIKGLRKKLDVMFDFKAFGK